MVKGELIVADPAGALLLGTSEGLPVVSGPADTPELLKSELAFGIPLLVLLALTLEETKDLRLEAMLVIWASELDELDIDAPKELLACDTVESDWLPVRPAAETVFVIDPGVDIEAEVPDLLPPGD